MQNNSNSPSAGQRFQTLAIIALLAMTAFVYWRYRGELTITRLAEHEQLLRQWQEARPLFVYAGAFLVYAVLTGIPFFPGATVLSLTYGWFFGFPRALLLVSFASTAGASLSFLVSRYLFRDALERRWGERLARLRETLDREGPFYLFTLRLLPIFPFFLVNLLMGLTPMRVRTFWWISQLGMLPATCIYLWTGASIPELRTLAEQGVRGIMTPQLFLALTLLGLFPYMVRRLVRKWWPDTVPDASQGKSS